MENDAYEAFLSTTETGRRIRDILDAYDRLEEMQERFVYDFSVSCTSGCGECCRRYVPFLAENEADAAAYLIIRDGRDDEILSLLLSSDRSSPVCPLYDAGREFHCRCYSGRSLVCRLFGFSAVLDKRGKPCYSGCRWKKEERKLTQDELEGKMEDVPVMSIWGEALRGEGETIYVSLPKAIGKIRLLLSYSSSFPA